MDGELVVTLIENIGLGMAITGVVLCLYKFCQDLYKEAFKKGEK